MEVDTEGLSPQDTERISTVGKADCFDGLNKDKLLIFGSGTAFVDLCNSSDLGIEKRSILRKIKPSDMLTWINNRTGTKCAP